MIHDHERRDQRARLAGYLDAGGNYQDGTNPDPTYGGTVLPGDPITAQPPPSTSDSSGWTKIFTTITNDAAAIAAPLIRQSSIQAPYYIAGANGAQILYDPSTGKTANAGSAAQRTPAVVSQNILIAAGLGIAALLAFSVSGKR
jgi:hypothetical protein